MPGWLRESPEDYEITRHPNESAEDARVAADLAEWHAERAAERAAQAKVNAEKATAVAVVSLGFSIIGLAAQLGHVWGWW